ncbi:hypothetical protein ACFWBI_19175 [Streptomyces sp. NPDC059982]|uniref:hypothetical protein n=1 Tax=unclassified Streptomyces TaxID=2593676 RepID=UPI00369DE375
MAADSQAAAAPGIAHVVGQVLADAPTDVVPTLQAGGTAGAVVENVVARYR